MSVTASQAARGLKPTFLMLAKSAEELWIELYVAADSQKLCAEALQ